MFSVCIYNVVRMPENVSKNGVKPLEAFSFKRIRRVRIFVTELFHQILDANLMRCQWVEKMSFLPYDLVLWCGCSAAILYHILEAMSIPLSQKDEKVTSNQRACVLQSMSKMGGLSSIAPQDSRNISLFPGVRGSLPRTPSTTGSDSEEQETLISPHLWQHTRSCQRCGLCSSSQTHQWFIPRSSWQRTPLLRSMWLVSRWTLALEPTTKASRCQEAFAA